MRDVPYPTSQKLTALIYNCLGGSRAYLWHLPKALEIKLVPPNGVAVESFERASLTNHGQWRRSIPNFSETYCFYSIIASAVHGLPLACTKGFGNKIDPSK